MPPTATARRNGRAPRAAEAAPAPPDDPRKLVIETRGLTKIYPGGVKAVDHLDLAVHQGEIFGLLGPNGAGKTTTAGMLTTRVTPTSGQALVGGIDVVRRPAAAKRLLGVVPQTNTLDRSLSVWENLYYHGRFFGMDAKTARSESTRLLHQFRLAERAEAPVLALSGGMAQRLMVARAVMHRPSILFLDEPTAGLDPQSRIALWEILGELHVDGQTILLTTHYMEEADQLCDRVAIIDQGRVVALDTPAGLKRSVGADTTIKVSTDGDAEALAALLRKQIKGATEATVIDGSVLLGVQGAARVVPTVVEVAGKKGFHITDLSVSETTLETVFISLTGKDLRE
jgi:ABC-2 type transport system ATP-binding protein